MKPRSQIQEFSEINLGDYVRACVELESAPETCVEIARLLGLIPLAGPTPPRSPVTPMPPDFEGPLSGSGIAREASAIGNLSATSVREQIAPADPDAPELPADLSPLPAEAVNIPLADLDDLPADTPFTPPPEIEPLFAPLQTRTLLNRALARFPVPGPWDIPRVVERCAKGEALTQVPRLPQLALSAGVQLLVDRSDAMMAFSQDETRLERAIRTLVGGAKVQVLSYDVFPWRAGSGGKRRWKSYEEQMPPPGTVVALLGDLGIGQAAWLPPPPPPAAWHAFARTLSRRGCPLVAFVPYPANRWPAELKHSIAIIHWDRPTRLSTIRGSAGFARVIP